MFTWDPYTDVILARTDGKVVFKDMIKGETFVEEAVEGGKKMILVIYQIFYKVFLTNI